MWLFGFLRYRAIYYWIYMWKHRLLSESSAWHSFLCLPPPLSQMSDFVFLAICSHCAALPDRRHSGRLGSVNCKGMWHSFLKLRMFLWISGSDLCHFPWGVWRKCFWTDTQVDIGLDILSCIHDWQQQTGGGDNKIFILSPCDDIKGLWQRLIHY